MTRAKEEQHPLSEFPQIKGNFSLPKISKQERSAIIQRMATNMAQSMKRMENPDVWKHVSSKNGLMTFSTTEVNQGPLLHRAETEYYGTLSELTEFFKASTGDDHLKRERRLRSGAIDYQVLHQLEKPNAKQRHYSIQLNWACYQFQSPGKTIMRDMVFLEHTNVITTDDGLKRFVLYRESMPVPGVDSLDGIKRASQNVLMVFKDSPRGKPGVLHGTILSNVDLAGDIPIVFRTMFSSQSVAIMNRIKSVIAADYIRNIPFCQPADLQPMKDAKVCPCCDKKFGGKLSSIVGSGSSKSHCMICAQVICKSCSDIYNVNLAIVGDTSIRICAPCHLQVRERRIDLQQHRIEKQASTSLDDIHEFGISSVDVAQDTEYTNRVSDDVILDTTSMPSTISLLPEKTLARLESTASTSSCNSGGSPNLVAAAGLEGEKVSLVAMTVEETGDISL